MSNYLLTFSATHNLCCLKSCLLKKNDRKKLKRLVKLYDKGIKKLEDEFSMERILDQLREMHIYLEDLGMDEGKRFIIQHNQQNVINVESSDTETKG